MSNVTPLNPDNQELTNEGQLRQTIKCMDELSQLANDEIQGLAHLVLIAIDAPGLEKAGRRKAIAQGLHAIIYRSTSVMNDINCAAEEMGSNFKN